jgi:hypothetical protein
MLLKQPSFKRCAHVQKIANGPKAVCSGRRQDQDIETAVNEKFNHVIRRRSFLQDLGIAAASSALLPAAGLLTAKQAQASELDHHGPLSRGDAAILRFLAAAELIESDLWTQYNELGGANGGNPAYIAALENLDGDMPQYISDNTDDELSHAAFLNAYLKLKGAQPVKLDAFRTLPSSQATGAKQIGRLTNLLNLDVDLSWYTRYRSEENPDFGAKFKGPFTISNQPTVPLNDTDTRPNTPQPAPSNYPAVPPHAGNRQHRWLPLRLHRAGWSQPIHQHGSQGQRSGGSAHRG